MIFIIMKHTTHENFVESIKKVLPNIKIIGTYTLSKHKIMVEDNFGLKYNVYPNSLLKGTYPTIKTTIDVEEYLRVMLSEKNQLEYISGFTGYKNKILVKDCDDILYECSCADLLRKDFSLPGLKSAVNKTDGFIKKSKKVHGDVYNYSLVEYVDTRNMVKIICNLHGEFSQKPFNHLRGSGCPKCGLKRTINNLTTNHVGWSLNKWKSVGVRNFGNPIVYIVKIYNNLESFIKIGRTYKSIENRMFFLSQLGYKFEIIKVIKGDYEFVYNTEKLLLMKFKKFKYRPMIKFNGFQECFDEKIINDVL